MTRREFVTLLGAAASLRLARLAHAQIPDRMRRVGILMGGAEQDLDWQRLEAAFEQQFRALGWSSGRDLRIDYRWPGDDIDRINALAIELVELGPEVVIASALSSVQAARSRLEKLPIVFVNVADPVASGLLKNPERPGGSMTGFSGVSSALCTKWLSLIRELSPRTTRVGLIFNPDTATHVAKLIAPLQAAATAVGAMPISMPVRTEGEAERAIESFARSPNGALFALPESSTVFHRTTIIETTNRLRLPALFPFRFCAIGGGLASYGLDIVAQCKGAASYADKILRGTNPGDLPVQAPTKMELVINQKTAKALGLTVPETLLARADEVIE